MKKTAIATVILLCAALLTACASKGEAMLPEELPVELAFASGMGAWTTELTLERDGSFRGEFHDLNMGDNGEGYPNGTVYICSFSGQFSGIEKRNKTSYSMTLTELQSDYERGKEWIEDGIRYVSSSPYGVEGGDEFILYLPDTPTDTLDEDFLSWRQCWIPDGEKPETLKLYGLHNVKMGCGFFG